MDRVVLIDSNSLINRAFYALPPLTTKSGLPTNAVYGYLSMLSKIIEDIKPTHIVCAFDLKAPTFRHKMYTGYKATRKPMPEGLIPQIPLLKEVLNTMDIKIAEKEGYEADDILGTLAKRFPVETFVISGDRDCLQLVSDSTKVCMTKTGTTDLKIYTPSLLLSEGFTPEQIIEYKALAGDSSDNIPGCAGVGQKTANALLEQYKSVDGVYEHIEEIKGKLQERLIDNREMVDLSKKLATINTDSPIECELGDAKFIYPFSSSAFDKLNELEFKKLIPRFKFLKEQKISAKLESEAVILSDSASLNKILNDNILKENIALYIGEEISFAFDENLCYKVVNEQSFFDEGITYSEALKTLSYFLASDKKKKIVFDAKSIKYVLNKEFLELSPPYEDLMLKAYLVNAGKSPSNVTELIDSNALSVNNIPCEMLFVDRLLSEEINKLDLKSLYYDIELPLVEVLYETEQNGFSVDLNVLEELSTSIKNEIDEIQSKIYDLVGYEFNISSNKQLGEILFERLGLTHGKKNKTGYVVDADTLEKLSGSHPIIPLILTYRTKTKLFSTYLNGIRPLIRTDRKLHTVFKQCVTSTGRLSSTEPNLQNIPVREAEGREVRKMFVASEGCKLISADYSQIELRLLAAFSEDEKLISAYKNNRDIHRTTASEVFNVPIEYVTNEMRSNAKAVNFGIIYGISNFGLANNLSIPNYVAKQFIEKYFDTYKKVKQYMDNNIKEAKEKGYIRTYFNRIRFIPELSSPNFNIRSFGERAAMNMPLQGASADIIKIAMLKVNRVLKKNELHAKLILQVHDELIVDTPFEEVDTVKEILRNEMENAVTLSVPLVVDISEGKNWFEAK